MGESRKERRAHDRSEAWETVSHNNAQITSETDGKLNHVGLIYLPGNHGVECLPPVEPVVLVLSRCNLNIFPMVSGMSTEVDIIFSACGFVRVSVRHPVSALW